MFKNLPAMQRTQVQSLGWEDPLEEGMATHSSIIARRTPWTEETEIDVFLELSCLFHGPADAGNLISGSSAFSKTSLNRKAVRDRLALQGGTGDFP